MPSVFISSTDPPVGIALTQDFSVRVWNRTGMTVQPGYTPHLDIANQAGFSPNWLQGEQDSVWANVVFSISSPTKDVDFDDKPYTVVKATTEDNQSMRVSLWSPEISVRCQCPAVSPAPNPIPAGQPINAPTAINGPPPVNYNRDLTAQVASVNRFTPAYVSLTPAQGRELGLDPASPSGTAGGAKYTGRLWESIGHAVTGNRLCLWNGWTGFGTVSQRNP